MPVRIDTSDSAQRWRFICPHCGSTNWRADNGKFGCPSCGRSLARLYDQREERYVPREDIEFVGAESSWKAPYAATER